MRTRQGKSCTQNNLSRSPLYHPTTSRRFNLERRPIQTHTIVRRSDRTSAISITKPCHGVNYRLVILYPELDVLQPNRDNATATLLQRLPSIWERLLDVKILIQTFLLVRKRHVLQLGAQGVTCSFCRLRSAVSSRVFDVQDHVLDGHVVELAERVGHGELLVDDDADALEREVALSG